MDVQSFPFKEEKSEFWPCGKMWCFIVFIGIPGKAIQESRKAFGAVLCSSFKEKMSSSDKTSNITASTLWQLFFTSLQQLTL